MTTTTAIDNPIETMRRVNNNLRTALINLRPERRHCSKIRPRDFSDLLSQLLQAAECLRHRALHPKIASALEEESREYRKNLETIKNFLPDLHIRLLAEKARLESARTHLAGATAWAQARKETL